MKINVLGWLIDFGLAWRLLTIIPLPFVPEDFERPAGYSAGYYPVVGLILGLVLSGMGDLFNQTLPLGIAATLLLMVWVMLTGLLHLDGLMDSCDGLLPPRDPARRLEIMKDSRVGAFGVVGAILLLLLKYNALLALLSGQQLLALIAIPVLARWAMVWQMGRYPLARPEGLSVFFGAGLRWRQLLAASLMALVVTVGVLGVAGVWLIGAAWLVATVLARFALARLSGLTGDVYGATCEVVEGVSLVLLAVVY